MANVDRNTFVEGPWTLKKVENLAICDSFDCGDDDLNEYFQVDVRHYKEALLTQTYCLQETAAPDLTLALLDFCNDTVRFEKYRGKIEIDAHKELRFLPAVKLTRLGVAKQFQGMSIGSHVLNMIKKFFTVDNRTGCRLITVDAYNNPRVLNFYAKNEFHPFYDKDKTKRTRSLYFDLKRLEWT